MKSSFRMVCAAIALTFAGYEFAAANSVLWVDVPFVAQSREGCGSAVISMMMQYWAKQRGQSPLPSMDSGTIQQLLYSPTQKGIPARAMQRYFEQNGYRALSFRGDWDELRRHLEQGRPLIVSLKASGEHGPLHYVVVVGLDSERDYIFLNDPAVGKMLRMSREGFQSEWNLAGNWTLLVVPGSDT